jgi:phosphoribosyl 1,2-cyclic phosphate phosphodiesterase
MTFRKPLEPGRMRLEFLGTGGSFGTPVITCPCPVCNAPQDKDLRLRSSVLLEWGSTTVVVDTGPDFRAQCLRADIRSLDAVWYTHEHADHTAGLDDLRPFSLPGHPLTIRGQQYVLELLMRRHAYAFSLLADPNGVSKPSLVPQIITEPFLEADQLVIPIPVKHGPFDVLGFRVGNLAYVTDVNFIPESSIELLQGLDVLVLSGLRPQPHPTHFHLDAAVEMALRLGAKRTFLTHLTHDLSHSDLTARLPEGIEAAWDGLQVEIDL